MNQNSKTDSITLTHPLMLLSIFVLLINDHILKVHFPSAWTGKISDFAGLFFFPILLSAILYFVLKSFHFQSRNIAFASFGFTGIIFTLIKTVPFFNDFIEELFSIKITLDPSDLIALIMFPLAWKLREKVENKSKTGFSKLSYLVLGIASLATVATSPPFTPTIRNLIVHENIIYAEFNYEEYFFYSADGGITWQEVEFEIPKQVFEQLGKYPELPFTLCLPDNKSICYQTSQEAILESNDGMQTWFTSWEFPLGRRDFFERASYHYNYLGPYDITQVELEGRQIIVVAMGSEGVLVKVDNNEWESRVVGIAGPIYFSAKDFSEVFRVVRREFYILCLLAFILLLINITVNIKNINSIGLKRLGVLLFMTIMIIFINVILLAGGFFLLFLNCLTIVLLFGLLTVIFIIEQIINNTNQRAKINLVPLTLAALTSYVFFVLWVYGAIPVYETALWIALSLHILLLLWILYLPTKELLQAKRSRSKRDLHE